MSRPYEILTNSGFDLEKAVFLAEASQAAYNDDVSAVAWANSRGFGTCRVFNRGNVQGFWCVAGNVGLLAFRGTSNPGQWLRDVRFFPTKHAWGWVHSGFKDGVEDVELDLSGFDAAINPSMQVWVTGHSLGGALAVVAAARLRMKGFSPRLYTYGQPRVGYTSFADRFAIELPGALHRFVNQSDIVTRVPSGLVYTHTGTVKRIVRPGVLETARETVEAIALLPAEIVAGFRQAGGISTLESATAVEESGLESPRVIESELPPLSDSEFASLQMALAAASTVPPAGDAPSGAPQTESVQLEGIFSMFKDHSITEYIRLLIEIQG